MPRFLPRGLGWQRDLPDPRDYTPTDRAVLGMLKGLKRPRPARSALPARVDWREYGPAIEDQQELDSCTAHACIGLVQYFHRRAAGRLIEPSRLFLYKMARRLWHGTGDTGASLRATLRAMVRFGLPPEAHWPYETARFDEEPPPFLYSFATAFQSIRYLRLDPLGASGDETLRTVKSFLAAGFPSVFGFSVFSSLSQDADIPTPTVYDSLRGGQAVVAIGYDDNRRIRSTKGALLIRNFHGFYILRADDKWWNSKYAKVECDVRVRAYQYNWKAEAVHGVINHGDDNIDLNTRFDDDRHFYYSFLGGKDDLAWIRVNVRIYAYARGSGSYAEMNFATGDANYVAVPHCHIY